MRKLEVIIIFYCTLLQSLKNSSQLAASNGSALKILYVLYFINSRINLQYFQYNISIIYDSHTLNARIPQHDTELELKSIVKLHLDTVFLLYVLQAIFCTFSSMSLKCM